MAFLQIRNIFDVTVSIFDHRRKIISNKWPGRELLANGCETWSDATLLDYIIDFDLPWCIKFLDSWLSSPQVINNAIPVVKYEELVGNPILTIRKLLTFAQIDNITDNEIESALKMILKHPEHEIIKFNKGVIGRGRKILAKKHIAEIVKYMDYYPKTCFSLVLN